ncbi:MAG: 30S ribosomal protein S6e [Nanoarchaeota archaeon]|nr:30S ribosomal protein S6e [Nanoarchaeota archaeon]
MKLNISEKTGKTYVKELDKSEQKFLTNKRIGETIKLDTIGLAGYEAQIMGGSDSQGFPMRKSILGTKRKKTLLIKGVGYKKPQNGQKKRKSVRGNQLDTDIKQVNMKIIKNGKTKLEEIFKKEDKTEEKPAEQ